MPILLGRTEKCHVRLNDSSISRVQCKVDYSGGKWRVYDGDGMKPSTNGTWLYADDEYTVKNGTIVKAGKSIFVLTVA